MSSFNIGDTVTAIYKTGKYIGEVTDIRPEHYLVRVLAVLKHPMQGDLHHPKQTGVGFFHERKALSFREQANIPRTMVRHFEECIPNYQDSLHEALSKMKTELENDSSDWARKSLQSIETLQKEYF
ncbi:kinase-associated lipoprotein B [Bacillus massilinigeriensis]|uniref:kinase-associated lipoprotein B n=1 Tax=Bacillus mediterraneensis TaxID=1805474 RepID=UPI0008F831E1|nr:kinase-associated lipoprotein B [Bacillus mediterraneensis]